jgi:NAD(P)-dependent dehydrogenase (short-subunit alcohol dehydrogenase family)
MSKVCFVTGLTSGIGSEIAKAALAASHRVVALTACWRILNYGGETHV